MGTVTEDERLAVYEREREELAAAIIKAVNGQYIGKPPPLLTGWQERAVSAVLTAGWLPPAAVQERVDTTSQQGCEHLDGPYRKLLAERDEMLAHYSRALDEIYRLRQAMAYEAIVLDRNTGWRSLPVTVRRVMARQSERLFRAACGRVEFAYEDVKPATLREALIDAGASETLTRAQWEEKP